MKWYSNNIKKLIKKIDSENKWSEDEKRIPPWKHQLKSQDGGQITKMITGNKTQETETTLMTRFAVLLTVRWRPTRTQNNATTNQPIPQVSQNGTSSNTFITQEKEGEYANKTNPSFKTSEEITEGFKFISKAVTQPIAKRLHSRKGKEIFEEPKQKKKK
ncbi:6761_t:CDS:2, partial [Dentiscutata erythropus]